MTTSTWIDNPEKLIARLIKVHAPRDGRLSVTLEDGRVCFRHGDALHSIELAASSTWRILHHMDGFADQVGASMTTLQPGSFYVTADAQGRDQLVEITRVRSNAWSRYQGAYGTAVHGRIHYKTRSPGRERRLFVHVQETN